MTPRNINRILSNAKQLYLIISLSCIASLLLIQLLFFGLQFLHAESLKRSLHSVLRNEVNMKEPYRIAQSVNDMESLGLFRCSVLFEDSKNLVFQDLKFRQRGNECEQSFFSLNGVRVSTEVLSISGQSWRLSFLSLNPVSFYVFLWITRVCGVLCICLLIYFLHKRHSWNIYALELEKEHASEMSRQAVQVAHDIRSPLAVITQVDRNEDVYMRALFRLRELVDRLSGDSPEEEAEVSTFGNVIREALEEKGFEFPGRVQFSFRSDEANLPIVGDTFQWRRVLSNLLNNSIEAHSGEGAAQLGLNFFVSEDIGVLELRDHGRGIPACLISKIMERGGTFGKIGGKGLGISSAIAFMNSIGGELSIESEEGAGTTVRMAFPLLLQRDVVLVDDDHLVADLWARVAKNRGIKFNHFSNPEAFLESIDKISKKSSIYLDVNFSSQKFDLKMFGQLIQDSGFSSIFIATGFPKDQFKENSWATGVIGKEPPFL